MSAPDALTKLRSLGIRAELRADGSVALIPASLVPPELLAEAKAHRDELAAVLAHQSATVADTADTADAKFGTVTAGDNADAHSQGATVADAADANSQGATVADAADANSWPPGMNDPGLSIYTIRDLAIWYEEEGYRRRLGPDLDQAALDRDLRGLLAERGVFPEFVAVEFERVMQVVFPVPSDDRPRPGPAYRPKEQRP